MFLHLGRAPGGPSYGAPSLRSAQQPHLYCASRSLHLQPFLKRAHPLLCIKRHLVGCSTEKFHIRSGMSPSPFFVRRNLAMARGFVSQELTHQEENEGEDEAYTFNIPTDFPWTVNTSLFVHNLGTIHHGPLEGKYFNLSKKFPYPVGYTSIKVYKGKEYRQSIEEGPQGPVFVVKETELGEFKAESPQKVWSSVCGNSTIRVHGMRHFGFQSSEVIRVLLAMDSQSEKCTHSSEQPMPHSMDIASSVDMSLQKSCAKVANIQDFLDDTKLFGAEEVDDDTDGMYASGDDVHDNNDDYVTDDDDDNDFLGTGINIDVQCDEDDVSVNAYTDENNDESSDGVLYVKEAFENDLKKNETMPFFPNVFSEERPTTQRSKSTRIKRSFKAAPHKVTFTRMSRRTQDAIKQDVIKEDSVKEDGKDESPLITNVLFSNPNISRKKTLLAAERQVWRKGEGLSGYVPGHNKEGTVAGVVPGYYRQRAAEKVTAGEQVSGLDKCEWDSTSEEFNDSRASESLNNVNLMKLQEGSILKVKEESSESSKSLLELLDKWNRSKNRDCESENKPQNWRSKMHRSLREDIDELNVENERPFFIPDCGNASQAGVYLDRDENAMLKELRSANNIDESTKFAVSKLFEIDAKLNVFLDDGGALSRCLKPTLNGAKTVSPNTSKWTEILDNNLDFAAADGPKNVAQIGDTMSKFSRDLGEDEKIVEALEEKIKMTQRSSNEVRLIEDVRNLIANKSFGNVLEKVKAMKLSGMTIKEDVYEAVLGFELDPWQKEVFKQVQDGSSVLVSAPSGAGKSAIADCCIFNNVVNEQRALFVTPYENLATLSLHKFKSWLGESNVGGKWTIMRMQKSPKLVVITLKVLSKILHELNGPGGSDFRFFLDGVNMVVLDKFCTFTDTKYGRLWEEVLMLLDTKTSIIALTLPATNEEQIAAWMSMSRGPCKLINCNSEVVPKRHLFCCKDGLYPLLNPDGLQVNKKLLKTKKINCKSMAKDPLDSSLWSGYNRPSLTYMLSVLEVDALLPAIVVFLDVKSCDDAMQDILSDDVDNFLSEKEIKDVEAFLEKLEEKHLGLPNYVDKADREGLRKGFAVHHEGKLPLWQDIVVELFQKNLVKVLIATDSTVLHTDFTACTVIISEISKVTQNGVSLIAHGQLLQLIGRAGRRGFDVEGNVIFLESIRFEPHDAASLVLNNAYSYFSCFKPSYSLVANLVAKHNISEVKRIISRSFSVFQFFTEYTRARKLKELDQEIFSCLEVKADLDSKLFEGLMQVNKHKLSNAPMFTRIDIRMAIHSLSQSGNVLPGILLSVVPGPTEAFYMVFGADNNFRLVSAGALDHVYAKEVYPLDVVFKESTGQVLQPPHVPPKESWTMDEVSSFGYIASGNSQTKKYVKLLLQYPVQPIMAKEGFQLRKDIFVLEAQLSNLIEKRKLLQTETGSLDWKSLKSYEAASWRVDESETWKEVTRVLHVLEKVDALFTIDSAGTYAKLKPLGVLISRLHNFENELWLAVALTSKYMRALSPAEFAGFLATVMPLDLERESLFTPGSELAYRVTKSLKDALAGLEVLRRQVATLQGSYSPVLYFDTAFAGIVNAWTRGKPETHGNYVISANNGDLAWRLRSIARLANLIYRACTQVSVEISEKDKYSNLSSLAKKAEDMLSRHLTVLNRT